MKWRLAIILTTLILSAVTPIIVSADAPTPTQIAQRLYEEPQLYCFSQWLGVPAEVVAVGKLQFDYNFGYRNNLTTRDQWVATWANRFQGFADWLGTPNLVGTSQCDRQVEALRRLGIIKDNPVWILP